MLVIDFLPVENEERDSSQSGDAIGVQVSVAGWPRPAVVVVDAGFNATGDDLVDHIRQFYRTNHIDVVISTHPDTDHLNGLSAILNNFTVGELMIHLPWNHDARYSSLGNYEKIRDLYDLAIAKGVPVREPFAGVRPIAGAVSIVGPSEDFYEEMLSAALDEVDGTGAVARAARKAVDALRLAGSAVLEKAAELAGYPVETLDNVDDTSPRNQTSAITLITEGDNRALLTGDTGIRGLDQAIDCYEQLIGPVELYPLTFLQAPHHGSRHNLGPAVLDRLLGTRQAPFSSPTSFISSARASEKHPSPKVTNALGRRSAKPFATEGQKIWHHRGDAPDRPGWVTLTPIPPLVEDD